MYLLKLEKDIRETYYENILVIPILPSDHIGHFFVFKTDNTKTQMPRSFLKTFVINDVLAGRLFGLQARSIDLSFLKSSSSLHRTLCTK